MIVLGSRAVVEGERVFSLICVNVAKAMRGKVAQISLVKNLIVVQVCMKGYFKNIYILPEYFINKQNNLISEYSN